MSVREHRTALDWAEEIKYLVDVMYPNVEKIILIMDNLNTHKPASLYKKFESAEARRILKSWRFTTHPSMEVDLILLK